MFIQRTKQYQYRRNFGINFRYKNTDNQRQVKVFCSPELQDKVKIFNTLTRRKEKFIPINHPEVKFYSCGPTVYDYAHIGNFRAFLTYDIVKRWLKYCGYDVDHVCNLTDVDDKIIIKVLAEKKSLKEITERYTKAFFEDLAVLNIIPANSYPKATDHIDDIENMIKTLIAKDFAYIENDSVYFRVSQFPSYGQLANIKLENMTAATTQQQEQGPNERRGVSEKQDSRDFALWKSYNSSTDGDIAWNASFGKGRPGWHIECSAMCNRLLGPSIDIHAGGVDLVFPHHQNEVAQSEAFSGQPFSRYWVHNGFVNINNEKMSKSLKNFKTLRDIVSKPSDARAFRFMVVTAQYRNPLNFNEESFQSAINSMKRIDKLISSIQSVLTASSCSSDPPCSQSEGGEPDLLLSLIVSCKADFETAMCDDFNTPRAVASLFRLVSAVEKAIGNSSYSNVISVGQDEVKVAHNFTSIHAAAALSTISAIDSVLGILYDVPADYFKKGSYDGEPGESVVGGGCSECTGVHSNGAQLEVVLAQVRDLAEKRRDLKKNKQFKEADEIRNRVAELGYGIKDTKDGYDVFLL
eukprot:gene29083-38142_t